MEEDSGLKNDIKGRVMALDVGERWIGVALSDPCGVLAVPLTRISALPIEAAMEGVRRLVHEHQATMLVVGIPYSMDGTIGKQAALVEDFAAKLRQSLSLSVQTWDERLSTIAARSRLRATGSSKGREKEKVDAEAAAYILEGYLERKRREEEDSQETAGD